MKPIKARGFNCLIQLWSVVETPDGIGGSITSEQFIGEVFARRTGTNTQMASGGTERVTNAESFGATYDRDAIGFIIRERSIDTTRDFVVYDGYKYTITGFEITQLRTQIKLICGNTNTKRNETPPSV